jgi:hypothetical protein
MKLDSQQINDVLDVAECCVHDKMHDPVEREFVQKGLKAIRALALLTVSETQAQESEDAARYRWFRDECSHDRRVEITEISGTPDMLEHHIDKGRCGL